MYLRTRFAKGTKEVSEFMEKKHRYVTLPNLADAHADLLAWQCGGGDSNTNNPYLGLCLSYSKYYRALKLGNARLDFFIPLRAMFRANDGVVSVSVSG